MREPIATITLGRKASASPVAASKSEPAGQLATVLLEPARTESQESLDSVQQGLGCPSPVFANQVGPAGSSRGTGAAFSLLWKIVH